MAQGSGDVTLALICGLGISSYQVSLTDGRYQKRYKHGPQEAFYDHQPGVLFSPKLDSGIKKRRQARCKRGQAEKEGIFEVDFGLFHSAL